MSNKHGNNPPETRAARNNQRSVPRTRIPFTSLLAEAAFIKSVVVSTASSPPNPNAPGLKTHGTYGGRPEQLKETLPMNPPDGDTVNIAMADCPAGIVKF